MLHACVTHQHSASFADMKDTLGLYTDYLLSDFGQTSATDLSRLLEGQLCYDSVSRFLSGSDFHSSTLWQKVKPLVRSHQSDDACLIFDDVIIEKPYTAENEIVYWHYDHTTNTTVKGVNMLNAFYHTQRPDMGQAVRIPVGFEVILKTITFCEIKTGKENRVSPVSKNELMRTMIKQVIRNQLKFKYILADSWRPLRGLPQPIICVSSKRRRNTSSLI